MGKAKARTYCQSRMAQCSQGHSHRPQFPCCTVPRWHRARRSSGSLVPTGHLGNLEKKHMRCNQCHFLFQDSCRFLLLPWRIKKNSKIELDCYMIQLYIPVSPVIKLQHTRTQLKRDQRLSPNFHHSFSVYSFGKQTILLPITSSKARHFLPWSSTSHTLLTCSTSLPSWANTLPCPRVTRGSSTAAPLPAAHPKAARLTSWTKKPQSQG